MIDALRSDEIITKVGGKFRLAALIQRRLEQLMEGARPLVDDCRDLTPMEIVVEEILQDKILFEETEEEATEEDSLAEVI